MSQTGFMNAAPIAESPVGSNAEIVLRTAPAQSVAADGESQADLHFVILSPRPITSSLEMK